MPYCVPLTRAWRREPTGAHRAAAIFLPCGTQGKISPIGCRKPARSPCLWVLCDLQTLIEEWIYIYRPSFPGQTWCNAQASFRPGGKLHRSTRSEP